MCRQCKQVGARPVPPQVRYGNNELDDMNIYGHTPNMADIDTRTWRGPVLHRSENEHAARSA